MKSTERRIEQLEAKTIKENVPSGLQKIYDLEADPESEISRELEQLYNPDRVTKNPSNAI